MQKNTVIFLKNLERFRLITFDITDTLLRFRLQPGQQFAETAYNFGEKIDPDSLKSCFKNEFKMMSEKYPNFGCNSALNWKDWWIELVERTFECTRQYSGDKEKLRDIAETLVRIYRTKESWLPIDGCHEIVNGVRDAGKCMGCISNFDPSLTNVLKEMNIAHHFDLIITSYEVGAQKPQEAIFRAALEKVPTQVSEKEALHIGNTYELDYLGARKAGWSSLLISPSMDTTHQGIREGHVYKTLRDLLTALQTKDLREIL